MKKLIKKCSIILLVVAIFLGCNSLFACSLFGNQKYYEKKNLDEACEAGWITQEHLKSIAYYYNNETKEPDFELIPKAELSKKVENTIKLSYLQQPSIKEDFPNARVSSVDTFEYFGAYNGFVVVWILDNLYMYDLKFYDEKIIGGVSFYDYIGLSVYNTNEYIQ